MQTEYEIPARRELDRDLVQAFAATFITRYDRFPIQRPDGSYATIQRKLSHHLPRAHLQGFLTLGAYALDADSQARWICLDADTRDQWERVFRLAADLEQQHVPAYLEASRRGGHLWLFFSVLPGAEARQFGQGLQAEYNLEDVELYPRQDALKTGPGSLVRLPLGIHRKDGKRHYFITLHSQPLAPTIREQAFLLAHPDQVPEGFIANMLAKHEESTRHSPAPSQPIEPGFTVDIAAARDQPDEPLSERLKRSISVLDYVSRFVNLNERGTGKCPFHDDGHPSFGVNAEEGYWHCWAGCGGGSIIDFAIKWRELHGEDSSFTATIKALADQLLPR